MTSITPTGIAYDDRGAGDITLLLLPGWCAPRTLFGPLLDRLDGSCRALAVDWRGHGDSTPAGGDFGAAELVEDALSVIDHAGVDAVVPVAVAHAGWVAIDLRRRLGPDRVPRIALLDWMVLGAPPPFLDALTGMASLATTRAVVDRVTGMWLGGLDIPALSAYVASMAAYPDGMWARAARSIAAAFARYGRPVDAIAGLDPVPPTLHLYAQPADPGYLEAQQRYADEHPWFSCHHLDASSHFPIFEVPDAIADRLRAFATEELALGGRTRTAYEPGRRTNAPTAHR
jgi:pimeloyl-ACP methyl ester carboxylesterase